jgi:hypothetical protein
MNLNFGFIKFFQEIAGEFGEQFAASIKQMKDFLKLKRGDVPSSTASAAGGLRFKPIHAVQLEPQLKIIDGATPGDVLKWLGIHKETLPATLHNGVTASLEKVLIAVMEAYRDVAMPPWLSSS